MNASNATSSPFILSDDRSTCSTAIERSFMTSVSRIRGIYRPVENSEGQPIAEGANQLSDFWQWFGESIVVDEQGRPLVVYRGEHGPNEQTGEFQSRLGSLSFGSKRAAKIYANTPNNRSIDRFARNPRVLAAYLQLEAPVIDEPNDPYVELGSLKAFLGNRLLGEIAADFSNEIMRTANWLENFTDFLDPQQVADEAPARLDDLYFLSYALLDNAKWVDRIKLLGFDGAIHCGSGATSGEPEYKVFSSAQAWNLACQMIDAR